MLTRSKAYTGGSNVPATGATLAVLDAGGDTAAIVCILGVRVKGTATPEDEVTLAGAVHFWTWPAVRVGGVEETTGSRGSSARGEKKLESGKSSAPVQVQVQVQ